MCRISTSYLRYCQIFFLITVTAAAVGFTSSISWCMNALWMACVSAMLSVMMWTIKAPCYVPLWSPGYKCFSVPDLLRVLDLLVQVRQSDCIMEHGMWSVPSLYVFGGTVGRQRHLLLPARRGKRIAQAVFNTLFTMDLWYDMTNFIHLAFVGGNNFGYYITVVLYSIFEPLDMFNLFIRTGYCLEDIPARSHLFNFMFEIPMMLFNIYVLLTCAFTAPMSTDLHSPHHLQLPR